MVEQKWKDEEEWRTIERKRKRKRACTTSFVQNEVLEKCFSQWSSSP